MVCRNRLKYDVITNTYKAEKKKCIQKCFHLERYNRFCFVCLFVVFFFCVRPAEWRLYDGDEYTFSNAKIYLLGSNLVAG